MSMGGNLHQIGAESRTAAESHTVGLATTRPGGLRRLGASDYSQKRTFQWRRNWGLN